MKKTLLLLGPTGVGKTAASLLLAQHLQTEIISSDSMQIYRGMDIGTAKPTRGEQTLVRHHMIDVADPWEHYSTGTYIETVAPLMEQLHAEGKTPLVVGGTGLYLKAMTRGIFKGPAADARLRADLQESERTAPGSLHKRLQELDPAAAARIMPNDLRRIVRALEVCLSGDATISDMQQHATKPLPYAFVRIGLTRERAELYRMIDARVEIMIRQGLVDEAKRVLAAIQKNIVQDASGTDTSHHSLLVADHRSVPALQAIGYKELISHFQGALSLRAAIDLIKQRSRNYAKRQFTWFRQQEPDVIWVDITGMTDPEPIFRKVLSALRGAIG